MITKPTQSEKQHALEMLNEFVKPGDTLYTIVRSVAKSGMSRRIDVITFKDGSPIYLTGYMVELGIAGMTRGGDGRGARINGCGMDMCHHAVYSLSQHLFNDSEALTERRI